MSDPNKPTILAVDDVPANILALNEILEPAGYRMLVALSGEIAIQSATKARPDLILLDIRMPGIDGIETCRRLKENPITRSIPIIFLTTTGSTDPLDEALAAGGVDYILKPFQADEVLSRIDTHLRPFLFERELERLNLELAAEVKKREHLEDALQKAGQRLTLAREEEARWWGVAGPPGSPLNGFATRSDLFGSIFNEVKRAQEMPQTHFILLGENGTGKEMTARAIHYGSSKADRPFLSVNCTTLPEDGAESLLFGHYHEGDDDVTDHRGYFELADGGTVFLDEIGAIPLSLQAKLLGVIETGEVRPVGSNEPRKVSARIIASSQNDLATKVAHGKFRSDLYYRLMGNHLTLPPLRERRDDIPALAMHFVKYFAQEMNRKVPEITPEAFQKLLSYHYPGNIRELRNIIERALIYATGDQILPNHIILPADQDNSSAPKEIDSLPFNLAEAENRLIERALRATSGNLSAAARLLGVSRFRIYSRRARAKNTESKEKDDKQK